LPRKVVSVVVSFSEVFCPVEKFSVLEALS
jgi:hypothetical protein